MFYSSHMYQNASVCDAVRPHEDSHDCDVVLSVEAQRIGARTLVGYNFVAKRSLTEERFGDGRENRCALQSSPFFVAV